MKSDYPTAWVLGFLVATLPWTWDRVLVLIGLYYAWRIYKYETKAKK